ncbi:hypothetical protein TRFO_29967 [Tritrichomonas foetus]|uniref:Raptor N-terminal CASPase-like domain-containing protein n=1 Tax=Tritrichomonas foetus TaxID=1144522 RepID=A0A1J4JVQ1_9EUKA|nr:hypothetical protein TRFO_29967 [Tritrichomonas foetus]|eukprot:OHT02778.1 hypothetical protein TRFO_29967 [Tritrichomonas foetus]
MPLFLKNEVANIFPYLFLRLFVLQLNISHQINTEFHQFDEIFQIFRKLLNCERMHRRVSRPNLLPNRPPRGFGVAQRNPMKTQSAVCFLCLFDGLRQQSIRRLVRRPLTVCSMPFLTFDPSYYSPSSQKAISDLYSNSIKISCEVTVDPSVSTVTALLRKHSSSIPPQRIILHIFGQGTHIPSDEGDVYFFTDTRERYKPMKIANILNICSCPITFIFDCSNAASLKPHLQNKRDVFAFFATSASENLQISTDAPLDLFTSCLFKHFETAFWYHNHRHRSIFDQKNDCGNEETLSKNSIESKSDKILKPLLEAILDAIIFETQTPENYALFSADPSVSHLIKGFALAQRVMLSFNVHPESLPELQPMHSHDIWATWDVAIDILLTSPENEAIQKIFSLFIDTFEFFPITGIIPLFNTFLGIPETHECSAKHLFQYSDGSLAAITEISRSSIPKNLAELESPSSYSLCLLAKSIAISQKTPFEAHTPLFFKLSKDPDIIKSGMLCVCCSITVEYQQVYQKLMQLCMDYAESCSPCSSLLIGLIFNKIGSLGNLPPFEISFLPLLKSNRSDFRAAAVYALGFSRQKNTIDAVLEVANDESPIVRIQVLFALFNFIKQSPNDTRLFQVLNLFENDPNQNFQKVLAQYKQVIEHVKRDKRAVLNVQNMIIQHVIESVKSPGFEERFQNDIFDIEIPAPPAPVEQSRLNFSFKSRLK